MHSSYSIRPFGMFMIAGMAFGCVAEAAEPIPAGEAEGASVARAAERENDNERISLDDGGPIPCDKWDDSLRGAGPGIGVVLQQRDGRWIVTRPLLGSPAEEAGLVEGDVVIAVGGVAMATDSPRTVLHRILPSLDKEDKLEISFLRAEQSVSLMVSFKPLRTLAEEDERRGGLQFGNCRTCTLCNFTTSGVLDCKPQGGQCAIPCTVV